MSLFEVKGWEVPHQTGVAGSLSHLSKKRKRPANDAGKVQSAQVNVEKLMRKVEKGAFSSRNEQKKERRNGQRIKGLQARSFGTSDDHRTKSRVKAKTQCKKREGEVESVVEESSNTANPPPPKRAKKTGSGIPTPSTVPPPKRVKKTGSGIPTPSTVPPPNRVKTAGSGVPTPAHAIDDAPSPSHRKKSGRLIQPSNGLTPLQASMKDTLDGARFRWINEILYTTGSADGCKLMREDPRLYEEYHIGFRQQVRHWPSNPVNHYISVLSSYPRGTVIADLGCGDAALAQTLVPKGYCVLSFDLVSDNTYVLEANVCERVPLPGTEDSVNVNRGQVVDVCVCALSLMSLDWIRCIREAWRVLRLGGDLKIAEVTSRFADVNEFIGVITDLGFKLKAKDDSNTHFILLDFQKISRPPLSIKEWDDLQAKHEVLQPCEYKRR